MSLPALIEKFRTVALDRVEKMNVLLVGLERKSDESAIEELTREIHTIKGEAKMMGFADVNLVSHLTEHLMLDAAKHSFEASRAPIELMFEGLDILRSLLTKTAGGASAPIDLAGFVDRVASARGATAAGEEHLAQRPMTQRRPAAPVDDAQLLRIQPGGTMRVDLEKLERLGEVAGEVLLAARRFEYQLGQLERVRAQFHRLRDDLEPILPKARIAQTREFGHRLDGLMGELRGSVAQTGHWALQLDGQTRDLRHVPLAQALQHYPRAVRDLAAAQGKQIRFEPRVAGVFVDRIVLNGLADPLLHIIRNAVDHGLETPEERVALGKPPEGEISLEADYAGDNVRVVLSDDGRGIDPDFVAEKAVSRGLITAKEKAAMNREERMALIFEAGFSTREKVTDVSGRGIGMDVVRRQIGLIGGTVEIESHIGAGTSFALVLPISSSISTVLVVSLQKSRFALPAKDVERVSFVTYEELEQAHGILHVVHDEQRIPLLDWRNVLGDPAREVPRGRLTVLVIKRGQRAVAIWVDEVVGEHDAMTRPLGEFLSGIRVCRGVAITDAGEVVPMLAVNELLTGENAAAAAQQQRIRATMELQRAFAVRTVLVVEDSEITRALVTSILRSQGFLVLQAEDGAEGWETLQARRVDLVLSDVQMPRMNGLSLLEKIRGDARFRDLPVVMLTTLGSSQDKERAMNLGASGYLVKLDFQERDLIQTVRRFLD